MAAVGAAVPGYEKRRRVANTLFMLGASFFLGGLKYHVQEYNRVGARMQAGLLFLATIALLIPSAAAQADVATMATFTRKLSLGLAGDYVWLKAALIF